MNHKTSDKTKLKPHVIAVTSGKGGVGKTLTSVNIAVSAQRMGLRTLILDGDLGLANVDVVLGLQARYNINDVLDGHAELKNIIIDGPFGIRIIPSGSGIARLTQLSYIQKAQLIDHVDKLDEAFDLIVIDTGAGISDQVMHFNHVADTNVVVTTPEPHAMTDAYALIKVLSESQNQFNCHVLVNMCKTGEEGISVYKRIATVAERFLGMPVSYLGHIPLDPQVQKAVVQRRAASEHSTMTLAGQAWIQVTRNLVERRQYIEKNLRAKSQVWRELIWHEQASTRSGLDSVNF